MPCCAWKWFPIVPVSSLIFNGANNNFPDFERKYSVVQERNLIIMTYEV